MYTQRIFAAVAALLISATLVSTAAAYPTTARSGTTTVTGTYRPLELNLSLSDGFQALNYQTYEGFSNFGYSATYGGTYTGIGYRASGAAGNWRLDLYGSTICGLTATGNTITVDACPSNSAPVGQLTYLGGGDYTGVPYEDTPLIGDLFYIYPTTGGVPFLEVSCLDGVGTCASFEVRLLQDLKHLGPYVGEGEGSSLDIDRVNEDCTSTTPCGTVPAAKFGTSSEPYLVPASRDACKNNGWKTLGRPNGSPFMNQGDCVSWVNTGK